MILFYMFLISQVQRHDLKRKPSCGKKSFVTRFKDNDLVVDKTAWIAEALTGPQFKLITRPHHFGKTTNLAMLGAFLKTDQKLESMDLFAGVAIGNDTKFEKIRTEHQHKYAVLYFPFSLCSDATNVLYARKKFTTIVRSSLGMYHDEYSRHFRPDETQFIKNIVNGDGDLSQVLAGYDQLIRILRANGYKIAILVDDYDAPFQNVIEKQIYNTDARWHFIYDNLYTETENFTRQFYMHFFRDGLKIPPDCGIIIGMFYMAKTSIFSDLTNFKAYTTLEDDKFGPYFGFSEHEVKGLIDSVETNLTYKELREWYDGYHVGHNVVFNPFYITSGLEEGTWKKDWDLEDLYWSGASSLNRIKHLIKCTGWYGMLDLHFLLSGQPLRKELQEELIYTDLHKSEKSYWTFLTDYGYVEAAKLDTGSSANPTYTIRIPNIELKFDLMTYFKSELEETKRKYESFVHTFNHLNNETSDFKKFVLARFNTRALYYLLPENAGLETFVTAFESLFVGFEFNHRSSGTLTMNATPIYQILFIKNDTAHAFNIAKMDAVSSDNDSPDIDQLLHLPLIEENLSVMKKLSISRFFKAGIMIIGKIGKDSRHEYSIAIKTTAPGDDYANLKSKISNLEKALAMKEVEIRILNKQLNETNSRYENIMKENGILETEKMNYQKEVTLIYAMWILEMLESDYGREYNATGTVRRGDNLRRAKWTFIFKNRRNETVIKHIINEINADGTNEEQIIDGIVKIAEVVSEREKKFVKEIVETGTYLNVEKHKFIFRRNQNMLMIPFEDVPEFVVKTATILEKAYVEDIVTKLTKKYDGNDE